MKFHRFSELWPMLEGAELDALTDDIKRLGLLHPILTYQGEILDGRNRYRACKAAGVEPNYSEAGVSGDDQALEYVVAMNERRRHMTTPERAFVAEKLATFKLGDNQFKKEGCSAEQPSGSDTKALRETSARLKVSYGSAARARIIRNHGTEADVAEVLSGKTSLNAKADEVRRRPRNSKTAAPSKPPPRTEPRMVFSSAGPLRALSMQEVEPGFSGTPTEFVDKYGHHQSSTAAERSKVVFTSWVGTMRSLLKAAKGLPTWPSDMPHWIEHLGEASPYEVSKLAEAIEFLRPKLAFAEALLARAQAVAVAKKRA
jgi:ParB-like chromosome segregation protein Spo0J